MDKIYCPICKSESKIQYSLDPDYIKNNLEKHFNTSIEEDIGLIHYDMVKCSNCTFTFAHPLKEGSGAFYSWITRQPGYYPEDRWEYHKIHNILKERESSLSLLDVGCGDGKFLAELIDLNHVKTVGVDTTPSSIQQCKSKNLEAYCMDIEEFLNENKQYRKFFNYIVSFHCLEHIGDPLFFLKSMLQALKPGGSIFISTPYSPMSFEVNWFDPLNHPPHHMGRWNASSYKELGRQLNLSVDFYMPETISIIKRAGIAFLYSKSGALREISKTNLIKLALQHPIAFCGHILKQLNREKVNGRPAAEVVLVEFKTK